MSMRDGTIETIERENAIFEAMAPRDNGSFANHATPLIKNCWYVAARRSEIDRSPFARRLLGMAANVDEIIAIELLAAAQGCDFHAPLTSSPALERVRTRIRQDAPTLADDPHFRPLMQASAAIVRSSAAAASSTDSVIDFSLSAHFT